MSTFDHFLKVTLIGDSGVGDVDTTETDERDKGDLGITQQLPIYPLRTIRSGNIKRCLPSLEALSGVILILHQLEEEGRVTGVIDLHSLIVTRTMNG